MNRRRLLYTALVAATLGLGVIVVTIVSGGAGATALQDKMAPIALPDPVSLSSVFSRIAEQIDPAVVRIDVVSKVSVPSRGGGRGGNRGGRGGQQAPPQERTEEVDSVGTGFIVDKAGYILTNHHVVENAVKISVVLDHKEDPLEAKLIGSDEKTDLAVIKIDAGRDLAIAKFGNSDAVKVGDWVLAVGSPFGFDHTVTAGIISARGRAASELANSNDAPNPFQTFLQTDAAINPGNSGGPLVSMSGEVIGVNTAIISESRGFSGLGFALPSNIAIKIYNQIAKTGKVTRGYIGISYLEDAKALAALGRKDGVIVDGVLEGGPSANAGIMTRDVLTQVDGKLITGEGALLDMIVDTPVGNTLSFKLLRDGRELTVPVVVGDRKIMDERLSAIAPSRPFPPTPSPDAPLRGAPTEPRNNSPFGLEVRTIEQADLRLYGLTSAAGVIVTKVDPDGAGAKARVLESTAITQMTADGQKSDIRNAEDFARVARSYKSGTVVLLGIISRNGLNSGQFSPGVVRLTVP